MRQLTIQEIVWQAADQLMAQGIRPTVANVREITQRGSAGTINDALKVWWQNIAKRISLQQQIQAELPSEISHLMQQLWQQALVAGEAAFEQHKQEAVDKIELAEKQKIGALERQQKAENMVQDLEIKLQKSQQQAQSTQTQLSTEKALREQEQQQLTTFKQQSKQTIHDLETLKNQLEREMALLVAQYTRNEQLVNEKTQTLEQQLIQQRQDFDAQLTQQAQTLQAYEMRISQSDMQLLQYQTELRLTQQQLENSLRENASFKQSVNNKRDALRAKLKRY
ncbi:MAG: DNA-binding protein [Moraxellaceae bacterium]|nr:DNA-binding protein [Moraxellaceae bacterium]